MKKGRLAYCSNCEDLVNFYTSYEQLHEHFKGKDIEYYFVVGRCSECGNEVATDTGYNFRKTEAKIHAYKKASGIIDTQEIEEILKKYDIGKETLADIAGFGKVTIKRYFAGVVPSIDHSKVLYEILENERFYTECVNKNKEKISKLALTKIERRYDLLMQIANSKIDQIANYIIVHLNEVTPLALEKLLYFCNGINYSINNEQMIFEPCQAWQHGPVYPTVYSKYKKYGYKPIDNGICSNHGCVISLLQDSEIKVIDLVIKTFGLYSPKTLEIISHSQDPWLEKREGLSENDAGHETIDEESIKLFYQENKLDSEDAIIKYIMEIVREYEKNSVN